MLKLIKYELKTISKEFLMILGAIILLNIALMTRINVWSNAVIMGVSLLICFGASVAVFIYNIIIFTRDLKRDTGYLLFSIPKSGYAILGTKLISSLIVMIVSIIVGVIMTILLGAVATNNLSSFIRGLINIKGIANINNLQLVLVMMIDALIIVLGYAETLLVIYFAVTLSKVIMNGRKFSGFVSFLIFIVTNLVIGKMYEGVARAIPKTINPYVTLYGNSITHSLPATNLSVLLIPVDIAGGILHLVFMIGLFIGIGYLLEKKIDL